MGEWLSVKEYAKRQKIEDPHKIYGWVKTGKLKEGKEWRKVKVTKTKIEIFYE